MKKFSFSVNNKDYNVNVISVEGTNATVLVNGVSYEVTINKEVKTLKTPTIVRSRVEPSTESDKSIAKTSSPVGAKGAGYIKAPLPGTIVSVQAEAGDTIRIGEQLLILEAMKMENNIKADKEGVITSIRVAPGDSVLEGDILLEIKALGEIGLQGDEA
ncbi:MAG: acetyl-CoA carboxylase biotin carboxyl carrier protein subunit [Ignavibacteriales bacterium]|nr:acetyl-CoA carboxylase biotin carboxyl carrier protein subunit [Ignavibacteriales bacterium]